MNLYTYVRNLPTSMRDPIGTEGYAGVLGRAQAAGDQMWGTFSRYGSPDNLANMPIIPMQGDLAGAVKYGGAMMLPNGRFYGNWGGTNWMGGRVVHHMEDLPAEMQAALRAVPPVDALDAAFKSHDFAMTEASRRFKYDDNCGQLPKEAQLHLDFYHAHLALLADLASLTPTTPEMAQARATAMQLFSQLAAAESRAANQLMGH